MCNGRKEKHWIAINIVSHILWAIILVKEYNLVYGRIVVLWRKISTIEEAANMLTPKCGDEYVNIPEELWEPLKMQVYYSYALVGLTVL